LLTLCLEQVRRYPLMQVTDLFKLAYQHVFGGGHLVTNEQESLERLRQEVQASAASHTPDLSHSITSTDADRFEPIGNDLYRLHLNGIENTGIEITTVNRFFIRTAEEITGTVDQFRETIGILREWILSGSSPFSLHEFDGLLLDYDFDTCPPFSHSPAFRSEYAPAYRIVHARYRDYFPIFCRIDSLLRSRSSLTIAIDGYCGSGKSTLAERLQRIYDCPVIPMDHFFLPPALRTEERLAEIGGNVDYDRFTREVGSGLKDGQPFTYRVYDCATKTMGQTVSIRPAKLVVVEGSYSLHPRLADAYDLKIFLDIDPREQMRRIRARNPGLVERFQNEWIPKENQYFQTMRIAEKSDLVLRPLKD